MEAVVFRTTVNKKSFCQHVPKKLTLRTEVCKISRFLLIQTCSQETVLLGSVIPMYCLKNPNKIKLSSEELKQSG